MAKYSPGELIGKQIVAKDNIVVYSDYIKRDNVTVIPKGKIIGYIFSWITDPQNVKNIYWKVENENGFFFVHHNVNEIELYK